MADLVFINHAYNLNTEIGEELARDLPNFIIKASNNTDLRPGRQVFTAGFDDAYRLFLIGQELYIETKASPAIKALSEAYQNDELLEGVDDYFAVEVALDRTLMEKYFTFKVTQRDGLQVTVKKEITIPPIYVPTNGNEIGSYFYNYILGRDRNYNSAVRPVGTVLTTKELAQFFCAIYLLKSGGFLADLPFEDMYAMIKLGLRLSGRKEQYPFLRRENKKWVTSSSLYTKIPHPAGTTGEAFRRSKKGFALSGAPGQTLHMNIDLALHNDNGNVRQDRNYISAASAMGTMVQFDWNSLEVIVRRHVANVVSLHPRGVIGRDRYNEWFQNYPFGLYYSSAFFPYTESVPNSAFDRRQRYLEENVFCLNNNFANVSWCNSYITTMFPEEVIIDKDILTGIIQVRNCYGELNLKDKSYTRTFMIGGHVYKIAPDEVFFINPVAYTGFVDASAVNENLHFTTFNAFNSKALRPMFDYVYTYYNGDSVNLNIGQSSLPTSEYGINRVNGKPFQYQPLSVHAMRPDGAVDGAMVYRAYGIVNKGATTIYEITDPQSGQVSYINRYAGPSIGSILNVPANEAECAKTVIGMGSERYQANAILDINTGIWYLDRQDAERKVQHFLTKQPIRNAAGDSIYGITFQVPHVFQPYGGLNNYQAKYSSTTTFNRPMAILSARTRKKTPGLMLDGTRGRYTDGLAKQRREGGGDVNSRFSIMDGAIRNDYLEGNSLTVNFAAFVTAKDSFKVRPDLTIEGTKLMWNGSGMADFVIHPLDRIENVVPSRMFTPWKYKSEIYAVKLPGETTTKAFAGNMEALAAETNARYMRPTNMSNVVSIGTLPYPAKVTSLDKFKVIPVNNPTTSINSPLNTSSVLAAYGNWANYQMVLRTSVMYDVAVTNAARESTPNKTDIFDPRRFSMLSKGFMTRGSKMHDREPWPYRILRNDGFRTIEMQASSAHLSSNAIARYNLIASYYKTDQDQLVSRESTYQQFHRVSLIDVVSARYGIAGRVFADARGAANTSRNEQFRQWAWNEPLPAAKDGESLVPFVIPTNGTRLVNYNGDQWSHRANILPSGEQATVRNRVLEMGIGAQYISCLVAFFDTTQKKLRNLFHVVFPPGFPQIYLSDIWLDEISGTTPLDKLGIALETGMLMMSLQGSGLADKLPQHLMSVRELLYTGLFSTVYEEVENLILSNFGVPFGMSGVHPREYGLKITDTNFVHFPPNLTGSRVLRTGSTKDDFKISYEPIKPSEKVSPYEIVETFDYEPDALSYENAKRSDENYRNPIKWMIPTVMDDRYLGLTVPGQLLYNKAKNKYEEVFYLRDMFGPDEPVFIVKCVGNAKIRIDDGNAWNNVEGTTYSDKGRVERSVTYTVVASGDRATNYVFVRAFYHHDRTKAYELKLYNGFRWMARNLFGFNLSNDIYGLANVRNNDNFTMSNKNINVRNDLFAGIPSSLGINATNWRCNHLGMPYLTPDEVFYQTESNASRDVITDHPFPFDKTKIYTVQEERNKYARFGVPMFFYVADTRGFTWNGGSVSAGCGGLNYEARRFFDGTVFNDFFSVPSAIPTQNFPSCSTPTLWAFRENKRVIYKEMSDQMKFGATIDPKKLTSMEYIANWDGTINTFMLSRVSNRRFEETETPANFYKGFINVDHHYTAMFNYAAVDSKLHVVHDFEVQKYVIRPFKKSEPIFYSFINVVVNEGSEVFINLNKSIVIDLIIPTNREREINFSIVNVEGENSVVYLQMAENTTITVNLISEAAGRTLGGNVVVTSLNPYPGKNIKFMYAGQDMRVDSPNANIKSVQNKRVRLATTVKD